MQQILHQYHATLLSSEVNTRFGDIAGGSIMAGYRFVLGDAPFKVSFTKGSDHSNVLVTWTGARIEETADVVDAVTLRVNATATDRMDSIYAVYTHSDPATAAAYVVVEGDALGNTGPAQDLSTHTLLGYVRVPANSGSLNSACLLPLPTGYAGLNVAGASTFSGAVDAFGTLRAHSAPVGPLDVTNKVYVDSLRQGLSLKDPVRVVTTGSNIALTGLQTLDGVTLASGDRVLVKDQTDATKNGIYVADTGSWTRAADADGSNPDGVSEVRSGMYVLVSEGTQFHGSGWTLTTPDPIIVGTSSLTFTQFASAGSSMAGEGLQKSGNVLSLVPATASTLGGVKTGDGIAISAAGVISASLGPGLVLSGTSPTKVIVPDFLLAGGNGGDNGSATQPARADHLHNGTYFTQTQLSTSGAGAAVHWNNVTNTPATYPPSAHTHPISDIINLQTSLNAKQDTITGAATTITGANLTVSKALVSDASGKVAASAVTATELGYVSGVTSAIQTQLSGKQATITGAATTIASSNLTASVALVSDASGKVAASAVTATELGYVSGVTAAIQTQLNGKQASITGGASTITSSNLTASMALVSDASGKVSVSTVTAAELGYVHGVTSAIQTQLNALQPTITGGASSITTANLTASVALVSDASGKVTSSATTATELGYVHGVTSAIQTQLNNKTDSATLAGTTGAGLVGITAISGITATTVQQALQALKGYTDSVAQSLDVKASVRAATTTNITLSGLQTIDSVTLVAGDRVLVMGQTTASQNGIYVAASGAWTRAVDANTSTEVTTGMFTFVEEGTNYANAGFVLTTPQPITLDSTALSFSQFSGAGQINTGTGLTKSGSTLSLTSGVIATPGTYRSVTVDTYGRVTAGTNPTTLAGYGITDAQATITGAATTITTSNLTTSKALVSDSSGKVATSAVTATELGYVSGVTSAIQTQLGNKLDLTNGGTVNASVTIQPSAAIGTTGGSLLESFLVNGKAGANVMKLVQRYNRTTAGTDWTGVDLELLRRTDTTDNQKIVLEGTAGGFNAVTVNGGTFKVNSNRVWDAGNFDPTTKANVSHTHDDIDIKDYQIYASNQDTTTYVYKTVQYKRTADNTLYMQSTLTNPDASGRYQTVTCQYYDAVGTTVITTKTWALTFDANGQIASKVVS